MEMPKRLSRARRETKTGMPNAAAGHGPLGRLDASRPRLEFEPMAMEGTAMHCRNRNNTSKLKASPRATTDAPGGRRTLANAREPPARNGDRAHANG